MQCHRCKYYMQGDEACLSCDFTAEVSHAGKSFVSLDASGDKGAALAEAVSVQAERYMDEMADEEQDPMVGDYAMRVAEAFREIAGLPPTPALAALRYIFRHMSEADIGRELGVTRQAVHSALRVARERSAYVRTALKKQ